jgi:protein SCO1/2
MREGGSMKLSMTMMLIFFSLSAVAAGSATLDKNSVYNLTSTWQTQDQKSVQLKTFLGRPVVMVMTYASCRTSCPMIVADLQKIEKSLPKQAAVSFVLASFASGKNVPQEQRDYAQMHGLALSHWTLLSSDPEAVRELAAVLNVQYKKDGNGGFQHSNVITVLDRQGKIVYQQKGLGNDPGEVIKALLMN